jgi:tRNA(Ile)-lysidine synthase
VLSSAASSQGIPAEGGNRFRGTEPRRIEDLEADRLFSSIDLSGGAIVAVSGGSDSTALLLLLKDHIERHSPTVRLLAVTVDHALRAGSAVEADAVARLCAEHGIPHKTVRWDGPKPATGLPAAARTARYRLLGRAAREAGIGLVLTGHTADDQAETVLMRQARAASAEAGPEADGRGLAGMAPATLYDGEMWIVRPLLGTRRADLRDWLAGQGAGWIEDPTNDNRTFERPRIRARLGDGAASQFGQAMATAERAASARIDLGMRAAALICAHARRPAPGLLRLAPAFAMAADKQAAVYALRILVAVAGGSSFLPDLARAEALFSRICGWRGPDPLRATLSHAVVDRRSAGLFLHREGRDLPPAGPARDGMVWDGRYRITLGDDGGEFLISAKRESAGAGALPDTGRAPASLVHAALAAEPVFSMEKQGSPSECPPASAQPVAAPFAHFLSGFDLAPARAVAELIGAAAIAAPPLGSIGLKPWSKA